MGDISILVILLLTVEQPNQVTSDFEGSMIGGYGVSLYVTPESKLRTLGNDRDLNDDGWLDLVIINEFEWQDGQQIHDTYSYVFWGGPNGFVRTNCDSFETHGAECSALADFDRDGWTDIVIANSTYKYSYLIYGSPQGYTDAKKDSFQARSNHGSISVADLNRDGWLDLVWSNWFGWGEYSRIYFGSVEGFDEERTDSLPTGPAHGNLVADFDDDGFPDIFWAVYYKKDDPTQNPSLIYWGAQDGFDANRHTELATIGPGDDISIGDLNKDGLLDIVIPNHSREPPPAWTAYDYSYIYYGQGDRRFRKDSLYAYGPWASSVADVNSDGWLDIVFACSADDHSLLYEGSRSGFGKGRELPVENASCVILADLDNNEKCDILLGSQAGSSIDILYATLFGWNKANLPAGGVDAGLTNDLGDLANHNDEICYVSPMEPITYSFDSITVIKDFTLDYSTSWKGNEPSDARIELWISTSKDPSGKIWSDWIKITSHNQYPLLGRVFRYKLCFITNYQTSIELNGVEFDFGFEEAPDSTTIKQHGKRKFDIWFEQSSYLSVSSGWQQNHPVIYDRLGSKVCTLYPDPTGYVSWTGLDDIGLPLPCGSYFLVYNMMNKKFISKLTLLPE